MKVKIGRSSGPCTDLICEAKFTARQLELVKDVLAIVNDVTCNVEGWYVEYPDGRVVIPEFKQCPTA